MLGRKGTSFIMNAGAESSLCHPYSAGELLREELRTVLHREEDKNRVSDACIPCRTPGNRIIMPPSTVFQSMRGKYAWMWTREIFPNQEEYSVSLFPLPILHLVLFDISFTCWQIQQPGVLQLCLYCHCSPRHPAEQCDSNDALLYFGGAAEYSCCTQLRVSKMCPILQTSAACRKLPKLNTVCHRNCALGT